MEIKRLDPEAVARGEQGLIHDIVDHEGEHAVEAVEAPFIPFGVSGEETPLVEAALVQREIELKATLAYGEDEIRFCLDFLAQRRFNTEGMVSDIISLDDIVEKGFERLATTKGLVKVLVAP